MRNVGALAFQMTTALEGTTLNSPKRTVRHAALKGRSWPVTIKSKRGSLRMLANQVDGTNIVTATTTSAWSPLVGYQSANTGHVMETLLKSMPRRSPIELFLLRPDVGVCNAPWS